MENLNEVKMLWEKQTDEWLIKAATVDYKEYPVEIQEIIRNEINKRGLTGAKYCKPSITKEIAESVVGELFDPEKAGYVPRYSGLSKIFLPMIIFFEKGCGAIGVLIGEGLKNTFYKKIESPKDIIYHNNRDKN